MKKILFFIFLLLSTTYCFANETNIMPTQIGRVESIEYIDIDSDFAQTKQLVQIKITSRELKNNIIYIDNILTGNPYYDIKLKKGMKVLLHVEEENNTLNFSIADIQRANILIGLGLLFCGLLIYVGRKKGLYSLFSIIITCFLITKLLSPMMLAGINPIISTVIICIIATAVTMYLVGGFNKKSTAATLGCILSLIIAGSLSIITVKLAHLSGFSNEHSMFLYTAHPELNFIGIAVSAMILATMGAVMDVAMSIASTINEIYTIDNTKAIKELFLSGMNVGRDIIGTMANTLILVYLGSSIPLVLLASNIDMQKFLNLNQVTTEIASALIGSSAIIICVPITAIIASNLIKRDCKNTRFISFED